ncbi:MAG: thiamine phosphate synthase [Longimicrobiales bacterium]
MVGLAERLRLVVITDDEVLQHRRLIDVVSTALAAGAPAVQLRSKKASPRELLATAGRIREEAQRWNALFFMNDRVDLALAAHADGVHLGEDDLPVASARALGGPGLVIGFSASTPEEAREGVRQGADYIGCGSVFATTSKADAGAPIGTDGLAGVARAVDVPVVAIGGITVSSAQAVKESGAAGCAVIGAIMGAPDIPEAVVGLVSPWKGHP